MEILDRKKREEALKRKRENQQTTTFAGAGAEVGSRMRKSIISALPKPNYRTPTGTRPETRIAPVISRGVDVLKDRFSNRFAAGTAKAAERYPGMAQEKIQDRSFSTPRKTDIRSLYPARSGDLAKGLSEAEPMGLEERRKAFFGPGYVTQEDTPPTLRQPVQPRTIERIGGTTRDVTEQAPIERADYQTGQENILGRIPGYEEDRTRVYDPLGRKTYDSDTFIADYLSKGLEHKRGLETQKNLLKSQRDIQSISTEGIKDVARTKAAADRYGSDRSIEEASVRGPASQQKQFDPLKAQTDFSEALESEDNGLVAEHIRQAMAQDAATGERMFARMDAKRRKAVLAILNSLSGQGE